MSAGDTSPAIEHFEWGRIRIAGVGEVKDAKLYPGGARAWDWNETGTRHEPGIQPADVTELLDQGAEVVVLSKGVHERLQVCPETLELLQERGVEVQVLQSEAAVAAYEALRADRRVAALIHSTC